MSVTSKKLREERAQLTAQSRALADKIAAENRDFTAEERAEFDALEAAYKAKTQRVRDIERVEAEESEQSAFIERFDRDGHARRIGRGDSDPRAPRAVTDRDRLMAFSAWAKSPRGIDPSEEEAEACRLLGVRPSSNHMTMSGLIRTPQHRLLQAAFRSGRPEMAAELARERFGAAMTNETGTSGGYLTGPGELAGQLEINMLAYGGLLQVADTMLTDTGEEIAWVSMDDTANQGRRIAVNAAVASTAQPTLHQDKWLAHEYTSDAVLIPFRLQEDDLFSLPTVLGPILGERLGRVFNSECTTGTGNSMPWGLVVRAGTFSAASATAIAWDDIVKLEHAIDPAYRGLGCSYMMHDSISLLVRLLKDGDGRPLWADNLNSGRPDRLNNYPVVINQSQDSTVASGKKSIGFGLMSDYKVRRVNEIRFKRLEELYAANDQIGFMAFMRGDGNLLTSGTVRVKYLTH